MDKKYIIEFIGTFFLILTIAFTGNPIAIGAVLTALVYMGGYISGAHYNPAVTLALLINKKITTPLALRYMLTQFGAGIAAAAVYLAIHGEKFVPKLAKHVSISSALLIEILFTFLLASVVLHVAATDKTKGNNYYGIAIGFTILAAALVGGPISGGAFNPAVGVSPLLFDINHLNSNIVNILIYLIGPFLGGIVAGFVYRIIK